jgi:hypothetical protein
MTLSFRTLLFFNLLLWTVYLAGAQNDTLFKIRHESYLKGSMTIIGNNIINTGKTQNPNNPYDKIDRSAKLNDQMDMKYITTVQSDDIFSASAADLIVENHLDTKIIYAGLYWSATYPYESGGQKKKKNFYAINKKREAIDQIMLLLPNQEKFLKITGEILFDGNNINGFDDSAPYVAYADITSVIQKLDKPFGPYTVGNIRATQGKISGGSAGGWIIVFVLENPNENGKQFITYDGFRNVKNQVIDIDFTGFKTPESDHIKARIAGAALEGDLNLKGDQLLFKTENVASFTFLNSHIRAHNNFFNSSITIENDYFNERNPNSKNTLGFDVFLMTIPNIENTVIPHNTTQATLRLKSTSDRFFMFFTALEIESVPSFFSEKAQESSAAINPEILSNNLASEVHNITIDGEQKGFFLIANVYSKVKYANAFQNKLTQENYEPKYFINPENGYRYIYIGFHKSYEEALNQYQLEKEKKHLSDVWITSVNLD